MSAAIGRSALIRLAALIVILAPLAVFAQGAATLEPVADPYFGLETYCESGKWGMRDLPAQGFTEVAYFRCAHRDGRFKLVQFTDRPLHDIAWTDAKKYYRYSESARLYQEYPIGEVPHFSPYGFRGELYPSFLSRMFPWRAVRMGGQDEQVSRPGSFLAADALSTPQHAVYERFVDDQKKTGERIWVLKRDQSIVRWEGLRDGAVERFVEISSQERNRPLTDADLSHEVPLLARFSLQSNPAAFLAGLLIATGLAGMLFWAWIYSRAASVEDVARKRRWLWRAQLWAFGGTAALLAGLAVLASIGRDSGHPPAIVIVFVIALWCGVGFGLAALFTLASYPVQWLFQRRARGNSASARP